MGYQWDTRPGKREPKNELERSTMLFSWENSLFQWPWLLCRKLWMSLPEAMSECSTDPPVALLVKSQAESDIDMTSRSLETIQHLEYSWDIWSDEYSWENPMAKIIQHIIHQIIHSNPPGRDLLMICKPWIFSWVDPPWPGDPWEGQKFLANGPFFLQLQVGYGQEVFRNFHSKTHHEWI